MNYRYGWIFGLILCLTACEEAAWNDPYPESQVESNILYLSFTEQPKRLDPATVYLVNEIQVVSQIYESPLQYHYLLRPYTLIPQTVTEVPIAQHFDAQDQLLPDNAPTEQIAYTLYELHVQPGIYYQQHPAFAKDAEGNYVYQNLTAEQLEDKYSLKDFPLLGTRELVAEDYVYQIKRLAAPNTFSPILGLMRQYIMGMDEYAKQLEVTFDDSDSEFIDLRKYPLVGAQEVDRYTYQIKINGKYPQFLYWLAMHFFAPVPWEADAFYLQPGLAERNISLNWYPIGTGPYQLRRMIRIGVWSSYVTLISMAKNTRLRVNLMTRKMVSSVYPAGEPLPFLDRIVYTFEKETIPQWNKFLQGYYDYLRLDSDTFAQAIQINTEGFALTDRLRNQGLGLQMRTSASVYYWGFNMLDPIVGGYSENARKLRKAISLAMDIEEYIAIFVNGLGVDATGPIPPDIFGYSEQQKLPTEEQSADDKIKYAKELLAQTNYPEGRNAQTGEPLVLAYDVATGGSPDDKARFGWLRKQLAELGINIEVRATQYSRFQQKMRNGDIQLFYWTWIGDYPDPENFLFLFYGPSSVAEKGGNNRSNYQNLEYDKLFEKMRNMDNTPERAAIIQQMLILLQQDMPWFGQFYPQIFSINHDWVKPTKPSDMIRNNLKYQKIDPLKRDRVREALNPPVLWPFAVLVLVFIVLLLPLIIGYYRKLHTCKNKE